MPGRSFLKNSIVRLCLMAAAAFVSGWLFLGRHNFWAGSFALIVTIALIAELVHFINQANRKIAYFFDAIRNDDSTLYFPEITGNKSLNELNSSLNKMNELIKGIKFKLQEQEQYYKTILEHVSVGILTINDKGSILQANSAAKKLLNYEHLSHVSQLERVDAKLFSAVKHLEPGEHKLIGLSTLNGFLQLSLKATRFITSEENLRLVTVQDIKNELEAKELESWVKLISVLTHEIMNTIAPITSLSETLLGYFRDSEKLLLNEKETANTSKGLEVINERAKGLMNFVESYRKLTRLPLPNKKNIGAGLLIEKIITLFNSDPANRNIEITFDINPAGLEIIADEEQISQVLINLSKNSLEALNGQANGKIVFKASLGENGRPVVSVADNGPGITPDLAEKIFIPFFTTKESGSGIGLSLSRQIMQMHGGSLKVTSIPEKSTTFIMYF